MNGKPIAGRVLFIYTFIHCSDISYLRGQNEMSETIVCEMIHSP